MSLLAAIAVLAPIAWACMGTPPPPKCSRSIYLAKFVPRTIPVQSLNSPITVPIGIGPFLLWEKDKRCAQPDTAELTLTLTCTSVYGGAPVVVGPLDFPMPTPKNPGIQQSPLQNFVIPAGTLTGQLPYTCKVEGTYTVTFKGGSVPQGSTTLSATGDTAACLVQASDVDPRLPRLDVGYVPTDPNGLEFFKTCRRGDQAILWFRVTNNDSSEAVTLDLSSLGRQTAGLPDGFNPNDPVAAANSFVHAISSPIPGTDTFMAEFTDQLDPKDIIPEVDATLVDPIAINKTGVVVPPQETRFFPITVRSHGMCADGSCNERGLDVTGFFGPPGDDDRAAACASSLLVVGNSAKPKSPLNEITDVLKCGPKIDSQWSRSDFFAPNGDPLQHSSTHAVGNLPFLPGNTKLTGPPLAKQFQTFPEVYPNSATDSVRTEEQVGFVTYAVNVFPAPTFTPVLNNVQIGGLNQVRKGQKIAMPLILPFPLFGLPKTIGINYNAATDQLTITGDTPFTGTLKDFRKRPPSGLRVDASTCRTYTCTGDLDQPVIGVEPLGSSHSADRPGCITLFEVFLDDAATRFDGPPTDDIWRAIPKPIDGHAVFGGTSGPLKQPISVIDTFRGGPTGNSDNVTIIQVDVPGAVNSPFAVPVHTRVKPDICIQDGDGTLQINSTTGEFLYTEGTPPTRIVSGTAKVKRKNGVITISGSGSLDFSSVPVAVTLLPPRITVEAQINADGSATASVDLAGAGSMLISLSDSNAFKTTP